MKQVTCIGTRGSPFQPHASIERLGGADWQEYEETAIRNIENGSEHYFILVNGQEARLVVARHGGRKYLKTELDGYAPDKLLQLPACGMA